MNFISLKPSTSTLIHEIEHSRREQNHLNVGAHDVIFEALGDKEVKSYTFNESTNKVYSEVLKNRLWNIIFSKI